MLSAADLLSIDNIVSKGVETRCTTPLFGKGLVLSQLLTESGFVSYAALPYLHYETPTQRTLWVAMADGRCVPELHVLALVRHGSPLPDHYVPVWMDGNPNNRTLEADDIAAKNDLY